MIKEVAKPAKPELLPDEILKDKSVEEKLKEVERAIAARQFEIDMLEKKKNESLVR